MTAPPRIALAVVAILPLVLATPARAAEPIPDIDIILEQNPGGVIKVDVDRPRVDEIVIEVPPGLFTNADVVLPPGWVIGRFSDVEAGMLVVVGDPADEGVEVELRNVDTIFETRVSVRQTTERWTPWLDRDDPGGVGDFETLADFVAAGLDCANPVAVECQTLDGVDHAEVGQAYTCDPETGGVCANADNRTPRSLFSLRGGNDGGCLDYRVRFRCAD